MNTGKGKKKPVLAAAGRKKKKGEFLNFRGEKKREPQSGWVVAGEVGCSLEREATPREKSAIHFVSKEGGIVPGNGGNAFLILSRQSPRGVSRTSKVGGCGGAKKKDQLAPKSTVATTEEKRGRLPGQRQYSLRKKKSVKAAKTAALEGRERKGYFPCAKKGPTSSSRREPRGKEKVGPAEKKRKGGLTKSSPKGEEKKATCPRGKNGRKGRKKHQPVPVEHKGRGKREKEKWPPLLRPAESDSSSGAKGPFHQERKGKHQRHKKTSILS